MELPAYTFCHPPVSGAPLSPPSPKSHVFMAIMILESFLMKYKVLSQVEEEVITIYNVNVNVYVDS
jgi:hypothetical protein